MESIKGKVAALQQLNWRLISRLAICVLIVVLFAWACISTSNTSDIQQKYAESRNAVGEALYGCANMMVLEFEKVDLAGADIQGEIIPSMRAYFSQLQALNNVMASAFGEDYEIFDAKLIQDTVLAFDAYDNAFETGHSTDSAHAQMENVMNRIRSTLHERYNTDASLK